MTQATKREGYYCGTMKARTLFSNAGHSCITPNSPDPSGMKEHGTPPGKPSYLTQVLEEGIGNTKWVMKEDS